MQLEFFKQNILPMKDKLFRLALFLLCNKADAEDIVQEAMIKIWNGDETEIGNYH